MCVFVRLFVGWQLLLRLSSPVFDALLSDPTAAPASATAAAATAAPAKSSVTSGSASASDSKPAASTSSAAAAADAKDHKSGAGAQSSGNKEQSWKVPADVTARREGSHFIIKVCLGCVCDL
jgi:hypothetical protein